MSFTCASPSAVTDTDTATLASRDSVRATTASAVHCGASVLVTSLYVRVERTARMPVAPTSHGPNTFSNATPRLPWYAPMPVELVASGAVADSGGVPVGNVTPASTAMPG